MLLGEPPPTQADLHFRLFGFPVRVHPFFWVATLLLMLGGGPVKPVEALVWISVVFVSILVHELGHALLQRLFGGHPWITLYGFGGLTSCQDYDRRTSRQIAVLLAGPGFGFLLAALVVAALWAGGHQGGMTLLPAPADLAEIANAGCYAVPMPFVTPYFRPFLNMAANRLAIDLLWVNIMWGMLNLLPIYPLDGGQITRELFTLRSPRQGIVASLWLSIIAAVVAALWLLSKEYRFAPFLFGYLAYTNYQTIRAYQQHWR